MGSARRIARARARAGASRRAARRPPRRAGARRARRGPGRDRQDPARSPRRAGARRRRRHARARRPRRRARARVSVRRRPAALRARARETDGARERLLAGAARRRAPCSSSFELAAGEGGHASFAVLHGLYWLTVNLTAEGAAAARRRRPALVRPAVAALPRLPRAPARGAAGARRVRPAPGRARRRHGAARRARRATRSPCRSQPRPLSEDGVAELVRERLGDGADERFAAACHAATGGNPLLSSELLKALAAEGARPDAAGSRRRSQELGPRAASRADAAAAGAAARATRSRSRVRSPCSATAPTWRTSRRSRSSSRASGGGDGRARRGRRSCGPESPLGFVHPLVAAAVYRDVPPGEREPSARARGAAARRRRRARRAGRGAPARDPAARRGLGRRGACARAARTALHTRRGRERRRLPRARARRAAAARAERPQAAARARARRGADARARRGDEHLGEAYEALDRPGGAGGRSRRCSSQRCSSRARRIEGAAVARRAAAELPAELADLRRALEALRAGGAALRPGDSEALRRLEPYRTTAGRRAWARRCSPPWPRTSGRSRPSPADACAELALHALAGGELIAADNGGVLHDRREHSCSRSPTATRRCDVWQAALADAHRRGSLFAIGGIHLWHGFTLYRRGELAEAVRELEAAADAFELWGFGVARGRLRERDPHATRWSSAARPRGARACSSSAAASRTSSHDGARFWLNARLELLVAEGRHEEALAAAERIARGWPARASTRRPGPWRSLAGAGARPARPARARRSRCGGGARARAPLGRAVGARPRAARARHARAGAAGSSHLEEAVDVLAGIARAARACEGARRARRRRSALARRASDAREPLRRALELADVCGADGA